MSRAWVEVSRGALLHNARIVADIAGPASLCAVVKADGYGHGARVVAEAALEGGATSLAVAQVAEGVALREAGIGAPIWLLSEPEPGEYPLARTHELEPPVYSEQGFEATLAAGVTDVQLMVDTGMHRVGVRWTDAADWATRIDRHPSLRLSGVWTHLAVADEPSNPFTAVQLERFENALAAIERAGVSVPLAHAANSAATIRLPHAHFDAVRCGIAIYGIDPSVEMTGWVDLRPAMRVVTRVAYVKQLEPGDRVGYGQEGIVDRPTTAATIPIGYADGIRRELWARGGCVLIDGRSMPFLGKVSMDQIVVDCGDHDVAPGDEVVLLGAQMSEEIPANRMGELLDTIGYEVVCDIGSRLDRIVVD